MRKRHRRFEVHHRAQRAGADALAKFRHFRMKPAVISKAERDSGFASGIDRSFRIILGQSKWLFAKNVFSCLGCSDYLLGMNGVWGAKHNSLNTRILQQRFKTFGKTKSVSFCERLHLRRNSTRCAGNKTDEITSLGGLDERFSPPAQPYDGRINHDVPLKVYERVNKSNSWSRHIPHPQ